MTEERSMLLSDTPTGGTVLMRRVQGGRGLAYRLASMGLFPGVPIRVYRNDRTGPVVIGLAGSRVMLGRNMAHRVWVAARRDGSDACASVLQNSGSPAVRAS